MSEGNVPPRNNDSDSLDSAARADQTPAFQPLNLSGIQDDWEIVPLMGMPALGDEAADIPPPSSTQGNREVELQARIQDLNRCNEVLLTRVHQLEEALERSQQARQQAAERSQQMTIEEKVAAAQSHSVAELLRDLEQSNEALERQTILAETLSAQLQTFQERSEQLEQECIALRQQHSEKTQQLQVTEEACADLRSRLQRQQRYTLQFKAALEKCLDTSAFKQTSSRIEDEPPFGNLTASGADDLNPLVMPRSERIQPWSAGESAAQDPHLWSLMRSQPAPASSESSASVPHPPAHLEEAAPISGVPVTPPAPDSPAEDANREAEQQLWQDVERVIETTAEAAQTEAEASTQDDAVREQAQFTEPIPWGAPVQKETADEETPQSAAEPQSDSSAPSAKEVSTTTSRSFSTSADEGQVDRYADVLHSYPTAASTASVPALETMKASHASPSPLVHPLKPTQRKRKSLSAVELPSFPPLPKVKN